MMMPRLTQSTHTFLLIVIFSLRSVISLMSDGSFSAAAESLTLSSSPMVKVTWEVNKTALYVDFELVAATGGWVGLGFAEFGNMALADVLMAGIRADGTPFLFDFFTFGTEPPQYDVYQDWDTKSVTKANNILTLKFGRKIFTSDLFDHNFTDQDIFFIWALGASADSLVYHGNDSSHRGSMGANILKKSGVLPNPNIDNQAELVGAVLLNISVMYAIEMGRYTKADQKIMSDECKDVPLFNFKLLLLRSVSAESGSENAIASDPKFKADTATAPNSSSSSSSSSSSCSFNSWFLQLLTSRQEYYQEQERSSEGAIEERQTPTKKQQLCGQYKWHISLAFMALGGGALQILVSGFLPICIEDTWIVWVAGHCLTMGDCIAVFALFILKITDPTFEKYTLTPDIGFAASLLADMKQNGVYMVATFYGIVIFDAMFCFLVIIIMCMASLCQRPYENNLG